MAPYPRRRVLAIIGSGETSPTMVTVHRDLLSRLDPGRPEAILLATPYAFQENAADVSARARRYFADSVGLRVRVTPGTSRDVDPAMAPPMVSGDAEDAKDAGAAGLESADWVFAGPGSPSYALAHWQAGPVAPALRERVLVGDGLTVLASAAAVTAGEFALPVYEIYKAGGALRWLAGLDLLGALGLKVAVIPHYDNAEGGRYDTRHCYLGARRLTVMERELPADAAVLGVDEHTAVLIDLRTGAVEIRGRGGVTVRRAGNSTILPFGTTLSTADLRALVRGVTRGNAGAAGAASRVRVGSDAERWEDAEGGSDAGGGSGEEGAGGVPGAVGEAGPEPLPLPEVMADAQLGFGIAAADRDADAMVEVILGLETAIRRWEADTDEDQGTEQARALLCSLIGRLGRAAQQGLAERGLADPEERLRPAVEPLLQLRNTLRGQGNFAAADAIRNALAAGRPRHQRHAGRHSLAVRGDDLARRRRTWPLHNHHVAIRAGPAARGRTTLSTLGLTARRPVVPGMRGADSCPA